MKASDLRNGMAIKIADQVNIITNTEHVKPGKGPAYVQVKVKNIESGSVVEKRLRSVEEVEQVNLDRRPMEYLYNDSSGFVFMDGETYDQVTLFEDLVGEQMGFVKANTEITVLFCEGRPVSVELPKVVDLEVSDTPPGIKNATATNQLKEATLETGLRTRVPPFINIGDVVRISTDDGSYNQRVND
ncbi:MAG: elongation factor P [Planctomycetota bacterium]|nr:elongation factor P [Planctomycetota bacterium]